MNYLKLIKGNLLDLLFDYYIFVDLPEPESLSIFINNNIKVKIKSVYIRPIDKYALITVRVSKKQERDFEWCMQELVNKFLVKNYTDYTSESEKLISYLKELDNEIR